LWRPTQWKRVLNGRQQNSKYIGQCEPKLHIHCRFAARNFTYIEAVRAKTPYTLSHLWATMGPQQVLKKVAP
jgi:hypothetical protein